MPADFDISPLIPPVQRPPEPAPAVPPSADNSMPKKIPSSTKILKALILVAAGLFVLTVASLWWGSNSFSDKGVSLTVEGPSSVASGDEVTYRIKYSNSTGVVLSDLSFRIFYPEGTLILKDGQPTRPESDGFTVDRLDQGQKGEKEFKVYLVGDKGSMKSARVHLIFKAGTLKSSFEKDATIATTIATLPINATLVAPPTSVAGQPVQYLLDLRNDSQTDMSGLRAVFTYPDGFSVQKMDPQPNEGNTIWNIGELKKDEGKRIAITGILQGNERETKTVKVALQHTLNGQYVDYVNSEAFTMISSPLLTVKLTPDDSRDYISFPGDNIRYTISYANNSQYTLMGLMLGVKLDGEMYNFSQLQVEKGFFDSSNNIVDFDSSGVPDFAALRPGQTGKLTFSVPLKSSLTGGGGTQNFFVKATSRLSTSNVPNGVDGSEIFALDSVITKISGQPSLLGAILYDNGNGSGPLPPKIGQETTFTVRWQVSNPGNDIRNSVVTAVLPPGVTFKGSATATNGSAPSFDRASNKVTWNIGLLPYGTGTGVPRYEAKFQISIKPSTNQSDQIVPLVAGSTLTGTDSFTSQAVSVRLRDLSTTDIENHSSDSRVQ